MPGALPGETVRAEAALIKKGYAVGVLREVLEASPRRAVPDCPVYADCGGCQISHLTYEGQLEAKRKRAAGAVSRIGGYPESLVLPVIPAPHPFGYRNKMAVPAGPGPEGAVLGCYRQGSHDIIPAPSCLIQRDANNRLLAAARAVMKKYRIAPYDEKTGKGSVRHILGRTGDEGRASGAGRRSPPPSAGSPLRSRRIPSFR